MTIRSLIERQLGSQLFASQIPINPNACSFTFTFIVVYSATFKKRVYCPRSFFAVLTPVLIFYIREELTPGLARLGRSVGLASTIAE